MYFKYNVVSQHDAVFASHFALHLLENLPRRAVFDDSNDSIITKLLIDYNWLPRKLIKSNLNQVIYIIKQYLKSANPMTLGGVVKTRPYPYLDCHLEEHI
jgi:hypothetical protein